jgi:CRISPR-associated protein (TIGR03986 family)
VEIVSYGKMERVMDRQLFYRSVRDPSYQQEFVERLPGRTTVAPHPAAPCYRTKIRAGFLRRQPDGTYVIEECTMARIDHHAPNPRGLARIPHIPGQTLMQGVGPNRRPNPVYQNGEIYVICDPTERDYFFPEVPRRHPNLYLRFRGVQQANFNVGTLAGAQKATLVITGHMQNKHMEFVFLHDHLHTHPISDELIRRFEDDDQITAWQEDAFPAGAGGRRRNGGLRDGEPVFFLLDATGCVRFFGRAQLFRLPYGTAPLDFLPAEHRSADLIDIAEAMFGFVRSKKVAGDQPQMVAGRVFVGDAHCCSGQENVWLSNDPITPHILSSPKPTTFQHYLVQTSDQRPNLKHYGSLGTNLRGHKLYWHKGSVGQAALEHPGPDAALSSQQTRLRPVRAGVRFSFSIDFENLSDVELGALLWVLRLCDDQWQREQRRGPYRLKLGMGKPLGMGALKLEYNLELSDRNARYKQLFDDAGWAEPPIALKEQATKALDAFESYVLRESGEQAADLHQTLRIKCFLALLSWPGPDPAITRYMEIERNQQHPQGYRPGRMNSGKVNEYSDRLVLPAPLQTYLPPPPPPPPQPPQQPIEVGTEITGNRKRVLRHQQLRRGVRVDLDLRKFAVPPGFTEVIGFIRWKVAKNQTSGGFRGFVQELVPDGKTLYIIVAPKA